MPLPTTPYLDPCQHLGIPHLILTSLYSQSVTKIRQLPGPLVAVERLRQSGLFLYKDQALHMVRLSVGVSPEDPLVVGGRVPPSLVLETWEQVRSPCLKQNSVDGRGRHGLVLPEPGLMLRNPGFYYF